METPPVELDDNSLVPLIAVISITNYCDVSNQAQTDIGAITNRSSIDLVKSICGFDQSVDNCGSTSSRTPCDGTLINGKAILNNKDTTVPADQSELKKGDHVTSNGTSKAPLPHDVMEKSDVASPSNGGVDGSPAVMPWTVETKYYEADVQFQIVTERSVGTAEFAERVEAVIVVWHVVEDMDLVTSWLPFLTQWEPNTSILVCDQVAESRKSLVNTWCTKHGFELVELDPDSESLAELEEYNEKHGAARVRQILAATSWSSIRMKENGSAERNERLRAFLDDDGEDPVCQSSPACAAIDGAVVESSPDQLSSRPPPTTMAPLPESKPVATKDSLNETMDKLNIGDSEDALLAVLNGGEDGQEEGASFEQLFAKFERLKEGAKDMPESERKQYAERVTVAFWKAIGGDEGEIEFSSDDGDDAD